jgi:hypothetical protein
METLQTIVIKQEYHDTNLPKTSAGGANAMSVPIRASPQQREALDEFFAGGIYRQREEVEELAARIDLYVGSTVCSEAKLTVLSKAFPLDIFVDDQTAGIQRTSEIAETKQLERYSWGCHDYGGRSTSCSTTSKKAPHSGPETLRRRRPQCILFDINPSDIHSSYHSSPRSSSPEQ